MLERWRHIKTALISADMIIKAGLDSQYHTNTGARIAAVKADNDEMLNTNAITDHVNIMLSATGKDMAKKTPNAVATPLPPLN